MIVLKCYQYRIYPTPEQEERFRQFSGCRRVVWNWALARRIEHYKQTGKSLSFEDQCKELTLLKQQQEYDYLQEADSQALQQVLRDLNQAFQNFFNNPKHFGFPKRRRNALLPTLFGYHNGCLSPKMVSAFRRWEWCRSSSIVFWKERSNRLPSSRNLTAEGRSPSSPTSNCLM